MTELGIVQDLQPFDLGGGMSVWFNNKWVASLGLEYPEKCGVAFGLQIVWTVLCGGAAVLKGGLGRLAITEDVLVDDRGYIYLTTYQDGMYIVRCTI